MPPLRSRRPQRERRERRRSRASALNGRPASASALQSRAGAPRASSPGGKAEAGADILSVLKNAARAEPAQALRELQKLHSQLTGAGGTKALTSLESAWQQSGTSAPSALPHMTSGGAPGAASTASALSAQQRELNQLTIQRQRLQQQQREQRTELHSVSSELEKRKNELRQVR